MTSQKSITLSRRIWAILPWIVIFLLILLILAMGAGIRAKKEALAEAKKEEVKSESPAVNVVVQKIVPMTLRHKIDLPAVVSAWEDLVIKAEIPGTVTRIHVREGEKVKKGQVLLELDKRDYINNLRSIEAQHTLAKTNYSRLSQLKNENAVAESRYDEAEAALQELDASLALARLNLERTAITAPFAGIINDLPAKIGTLLSVGDPVAHLLDIDRLKVEVAVPEADVDAVRQVDQAEIIFSALDGRKVIGRKIFLASKPTSASMVYIMRFVLDNPDHSILAGMFARANIIKSMQHHGIGIPLYSIITQGDNKFVFKVQDNVAVKQQVKTGFWENWKVQILDGLDFDDLVVIVGHRSLEDGQLVNVVKTLTDPGDISP